MYIHIFVNQFLRSMKRKEFLKKAAIGGAAIVAGTQMLKANNVKLKESNYDDFLKQTDFETIGYNHIPNNEYKTMNTVLHKANTRGHANHGWLDTHHTFSFANYRNPERMHFGVLRVLNDDVIKGGTGFGTHPHDNMEIISIPLRGGLEHQDSMGNKHVIKAGDVQIMSAGSGIMHSEYNMSKLEDTNFLQIWMFPKKKNVRPRYDQLSFPKEGRQNKLQQVLSPSSEDDGVWAHQDAWFYLGKYDAGKALKYRLNKTGNGVYLFLLEGEIQIGEQKLSKRDGFGVWNVEDLNIQANTESEFLLMEVPMTL